MGCNGRITWQRRRACQCGKGHNAFLWKTHNFDHPQISPLPQPTDTKLCTLDYLRVIIITFGCRWLPYTYVQYNASAWFLFFIFMPLGTRSNRTARRTDTPNGSNDVIWCKKVPFRGYIDIARRFEVKWHKLPKSWTSKGSFKSNQKCLTSER
jgi:hypothetical protein